ncbi:MAG: hypothetical protein JWO79_2146 [Actinomycetia bacterium]|jgi:hypothetical protein|nr:hypothetical protein [Actinomycetes bacterium]MDQ1656937.1 hypothetical protein [Cryptosporangiaceae bacterium]
MSDSLAAALRAFGQRHGGATAVLSYTGRRGTRIALVGADGRWGDLMAPGQAEAAAACESAGVPVSAGWDRELTGTVRTGPEEWRRMGGARRP